jgi:hypothetical protein
MTKDESAEPLKKVVGKKKPSDVWSELYRLNTFAANLGLHRARPMMDTLQKKLSDRLTR